VHVPQPPADAETPFVFTMEGSDRDAPAALVARFWAPGWNSVNALTRFQEEVAGPLRGGPSGVRLLRGDGAVAVPAAASPETADATIDRAAGRLRAVPLHDVFASDELAARTEAIRARAEAPVLVLHPEDALRLGVAAGDPVELQGACRPLRLAVRTDPAFARGHVGYPHGIEGAPPPGTTVLAVRPAAGTEA
jgi:NADH-quinone oxidoreductase subunit G